MVLKQEPAFSLSLYKPSTPAQLYTLKTIPCIKYFKVLIIALYHKKAYLHRLFYDIMRCFTLVGGDGFEPSKRDATDLQSAPFGHSGTLPYLIFLVDILLNSGAGGRIRTPDLLITNQLLYRLSYTSNFVNACYFNISLSFCQPLLFTLFTTFLMV